VLFDLLRNEYEVFYWKSKKAFEVDFVVHFKKKISHAIQVCFYLSNENRDREIRGLIAAANEIEAEKLFIITHEQDDLINFENNKIIVISYLNWLLNY
ncbi:MAG: hypothetical protein U9R54_07040, partial [Bacteroidota bacterium]|nr:hypothetical protein [Bacteroidota bacterium]